jgi:hypothetical protein
MKLLTITLSLFVLFSTSLFAQGQRGEPKDPKAIALEQTQMMKEKLNLTEEQEALILALNEEFAVKRNKLRAENKENRTQMRSAMKTTFVDQDQKMKEILTEDQYATFQEMRSERNRRRVGKMRKNKE